MLYSIQNPKVQQQIMASPLTEQEFREMMVFRQDLSSNMLVLTRKMTAGTIWELVAVDLFVRQLRHIGSVIACHRGTALSAVPTV
jgi:hypothetical protein